MQTVTTLTITLDDDLERDLREVARDATLEQAAVRELRARLFRRRLDELASPFETARREAGDTESEALQAFEREKHVRREAKRGS